MLSFTHTAPLVLSLHARKKPRAPPHLTRNLSPRRWQPVEKTDKHLKAVSEALSQWNSRTGNCGNYLPSDSDLRRCDVARELRLPTLITRAGGYRTVQSFLGLAPRGPSSRLSKERELAELARILKQICCDAGLPPPHVNFPEKSTIRRLSPKLGNRIAAFPGRNGYNRLAEYVKGKQKTKGGNGKVVEETGKWRFWTDPAEIRSALLAYQTHPQILPRLNTLPLELSAAIQRQGGAYSFALEHNMILERNWLNNVRFAKLVRWLAEEADQEGVWKKKLTSEKYLERVKEQASNPVELPDSARVNEAGLGVDVKRYGGRKALALRLGYAQQFCPRDMFMGGFSVQFAADLLEFAVWHVDTNQGDLAMPRVQSLEANGRIDLANAVTYFGGEDAVGRRVGLVQSESHE